MGDSGGPVLLETCHGLEVFGVIVSPLSGTPLYAAVNHPAFVGLERCTGDLNEDGTVDGIDIGVFLNNWGTPGCGGSQPCFADINCDGAVDGIDLGALLNEFGPCDQISAECCPESLMESEQGESSQGSLPAGTPDFSALMEWIGQASYEELLGWYLNGMPIPIVGGS